MSFKSQLSLLAALGAVMGIAQASQAPVVQTPPGAVCAATYQKAALVSTHYVPSQQDKLIGSLYCVYKAPVGSVLISASGLPNTTHFTDVIAETGWMVNFNSYDSTCVPDGNNVKCHFLPPVK